MANRGARWQRGTLRRRGDEWILRIREDVAADNGSMVRREKTLHVADARVVRTRTAARTLADAMIDKMTGRGLTPGSTILATEYLRRYIAERVEVLMKPASRSAVRSLINTHLMPLVTRLRLEQVNTRVAQRLVGEMVKRRCSPTTVRNAVRWLSTIVKAGAQDGYACVPIDVRAVKMPARIEVEAEQLAFNSAEATRLVFGSPYPWSLAYALQATLGLRCNEVLGLTWSSFDLAAGTVKIRQGAVLGRIQSLKSKASAKTLALPTSLRPLIERYREAWQPNDAGLLFATRTGRPFYGSWYRERLTRDLKRLGIPHRGTHAFRHFTATQLLASGQSPAAVRDQMRHSSLSTTNRYSHAVAGDLRRGVELLGDLLTHGAEPVTQVAGGCGSGVQTSAQTAGQ